MFNGERCRIFFLYIQGNLINIADLTIMVFKLVNHVLTPETKLLEIPYQIRIEDNKVTGKITLHKEVLVGGLNTGRAAHDIGDCRGWGNRQNVGIPHALFLNFCP